MSYYFGSLLALTVAFSWAVSTMIYDRIGRFVSSVRLNLLKNSIAVFLLLLTVLLSTERWVDTPFTNILLLFVSGVVGIGVGDTAYLSALKKIGPRKVSLVKTLSPPLASFISFVFLEETLSLGGILGILLATLGISIVVSEKKPITVEASTAGNEGRILKGVGLGFIAALSEAIGSVISRGVLTRADVSPFWGTLFRLSGAVFALFLTFHLIYKERKSKEKIAFSSKNWLLLMIAVLIGLYIGGWLQQISLKHIPAGIAQTLFAASPLFVFLLSVILRKEPVSFVSVGGTVLTFVGIACFFVL